MAFVLTGTTSTPSFSLSVPSSKFYTRFTRKFSSRHRELSISPITTNSSKRMHEFRSKSLKFAVSGALAIGIWLSGSGFVDAKVGVNKPELLPKEFSTVIDVAGFLSAGQESRLRQEITDLEDDTGFKLRVLAQNYPETPGLAIRDFWQVDDRTIVFVADPTFGNILNFNVGATVDLDIPRSFWSRLAGKYGNIFYWKEKGEDASVEAAVKAISACLREPVGRNNCSEMFCTRCPNRMQLFKSSIPTVVFQQLCWINSFSIFNNSLKQSQRLERKSFHQ